MSGTETGEVVVERTNTPIEELTATYNADGCDFTNLLWVKEAALRYAESMPDSQVRCLLHALAQNVTPAGDVSKYVPMIFHSRLLLVHPDIDQDVQAALIVAAMKHLVGLEEKHKLVTSAAATIRG